jgi:hypothetical protein
MPDMLLAGLLLLLAASQLQLALHQALTTLAGVQGLLLVVQSRHVLLCVADAAKLHVALLQEGPQKLECLLLCLLLLLPMLLLLLCLLLFLLGRVVVSASCLLLLVDTVLLLCWLSAGVSSCYICRLQQLTPMIPLLLCNSPAAALQASAACFGAAPNCSPAEKDNVLHIRSRAADTGVAGKKS